MQLFLLQQFNMTYLALVDVVLKKKDLDQITGIP